MMVADEVEPIPREIWNWVLLTEWENFGM